MKKILIIRFSAIGDIILSSAVIRNLSKHFPDAQIDFVTKKAFKSVVEFNPHINNKFYLEDDFSALVKELKFQQYDFIIDIHNSLRSKRLKKALKGKSYTFDKASRKKWIYVNFKKMVMPKKHVVDRYMDCLKPLGVENDGEGLDYYFDPKDEVDISQYGLKSNEYTALVIGGTYSTKRLPNEQLIKICHLRKEKVLILGGPDDIENSKVVEKATDNTINLCGQLSLNQSIYMLKDAKHVIAHDTGLMHAASALKKNIVSVWGNTVPEFGMYPYLPDGQSHIIIENKDLGCRPCSKLGYDACPKGHFKCMKDLDFSPIEALQ